MLLKRFKEKNPKHKRSYGLSDQAKQRPSKILVSHDQRAMIWYLLLKPDETGKEPRFQRQLAAKSKNAQNIKTSNIKIFFSMIMYRHIQQTPPYTGISWNHMIGGRWPMWIIHQTWHLTKTLKNSSMIHLPPKIANSLGAASINYPRFGKGKIRKNKSDIESDKNIISRGFKVIKGSGSVFAKYKWKEWMLKQER